MYNIVYKYKIGFRNECSYLSEAGSSFKNVLDRVVGDVDYTLITRRDTEYAVVMSLEYFNGLIETIHLLRSPANAEHLAKSIDQYRKGETVSQELDN